MKKRELRAFALCFLVGLSLALAEKASAALTWMAVVDLAPVSEMGTLSVLAVGIAGLALHPGARREDKS
jgi:hypothetical protein